MELRDSLAGSDDLVIVYVVAARQLNDKARRFAAAGFSEQVRFVSDPDSRVIESLGLLLEDPEPIAAGVPHPATYLIDRQGVVRFADVRSDYHIWLDAAVLADALAALP